MTSLNSEPIGLCATCIHCRIVQSARSTFYMCMRSIADDRFAKYPRLPVLHCVGYQTLAADEPPDPPHTPDER